MSVSDKRVLLEIAGIPDCWSSSELEVRLTQSIELVDRATMP